MPGDTTVTITGPTTTVTYDAYTTTVTTNAGGGVTDHGVLTGLTDDDHTQYIKDAEYTQDGGVLIGTGAGTFAEEIGATARASIGALGVISAATLPTSGRLAAVEYVLTAADDTAKAGKGRYRWDGSAWHCIAIEAYYVLGNLTATPSLSLIPGAGYIWTVSHAVTAATIAMTAVGEPCTITSLNAGGLAFLAANITATGRTLKTYGWDNIAEAVTAVTIEDDGTYLHLVCGVPD